MGSDAPGGQTLVGTLSELNVYPVKSLKGVALRSWPLAGNGLRFDRRWMVVDPGGRQLTQREEPRLCLITPSLEAAEGNGNLRAGSDPDATRLVLGAPGAGSVALSVVAPGAERRVRIWDDTAVASSSPPEVDAWLSAFLGRDVQLVRFGAVEPEDGRLWQRVAFPDSLPFLLISQASLDDVNRRLRVKGEPPVEMARFRPNFVVAGTDAFAEDGWRRIQIGELQFSVERPCARCVITTIDQQTAAVGREPLKTLAGYRTAVRESDGRQSRGVMFGQKLIHHELGTVALGDRVTLTSKRPRAEMLSFLPERSV